MTKLKTKLKAIMIKDLLMRHHHLTHPKTNQIIHLGTLRKVRFRAMTMMIIIVMKIQTKNISHLLLKSQNK